jgi:hypothetical protein
MATPKKPASKQPTPKRTDKTGASGMGMTKSGVRARATSAGLNEINARSFVGGKTKNEYSGLTTGVTVQQFSPKDPQGKQAFKAEKVAKQKVLKAYGMAANSASKKKK